MTTQPEGTAVRVPGTHCVSPYPNAEPGMLAPVKTAMAMTERARVPRRDLDLMLDMTRRPKTFHRRRRLTKRADTFADTSATLDGRLKQRDEGSQQRLGSGASDIWAVGYDGTIVKRRPWTLDELVRAPKSGACRSREPAASWVRRGPGRRAFAPPEVADRSELRRVHGVRSGSRIEAPGAW